MDRSKSQKPRPPSPEPALHSVSYGTFIPHFEIDSEYLRTFVGRNVRSCELPESASQKNSPGLYFPEYLGKELKGDNSDSDGDNFNTISDKSPSINTSYIGNFFTHCEDQLAKLFAFMDFHMRKVESDFEALKQSSRSLAELHVQSDSENLSDPCRVRILPAVPGKDQIQSSLDLLGQLRRVAVSLKESLSSSFAALDNLLVMHDRNHNNKQGRLYFESKIPKCDEYQKRINVCLENIDNESNTLYCKQGLKMDGSGRVRVRSESAITTDVREDPLSCFTYFHSLLFVVTAGLIVYMTCSDDHAMKWTVYLRLLRGPLLVLLFLYLFSVNMKVWALVRVDYVNIFDYHPNGTPTPRYVFRVAGLFCMFFSTMIVILLLTTPYTDEIPGKIVPLIMWTSLVLFLLNPFKILLRRSRLSFVFVFVRILLAPFTYVYFGDFWFADQLNSMVAILLDIQYFTCYMITDTWYGDVNATVCTSSGNGIRPVISCLPAMWRLLQCLRCFYDTKQVKHLVNMGKYMTTFPVVILATMFATKVDASFSFYRLDWKEVGWIIVLWLIFSFIHAIYTFLWDIYCDWGLWSFAKGSYFRKTLIYRYKIIYLSAIIFDFFLRFVWALKLSLAIVWHIDSDLIYTGELILSCSIKKQFFLVMKI